jgi:hypothetical protein
MLLLDEADTFLAGQSRAATRRDLATKERAVQEDQGRPDVVAKA